MPRATLSRGPTAQTDADLRPEGKAKAELSRDPTGGVEATLTIARPGE
jgi:hypothetical protein